MNSREGSKSDGEDDGDAGDVEGDESIIFSGPGTEEHLH